MNPRQRRGVVLLVLGGAGAVLVFVAIASYVAQVQASLPTMARVYRLADKVPAFNEVTIGILEEVEIPEEAAPPSAVLSEGELEGVVAATDLAPGSILQNDMLVPAAGIRSGQREIAILVSAETGVAGRITPGSQVDIFATFEKDVDTRCAGLLIPRAQVVAVGVAKAQAVPGRAGDILQEEVLPVTFALSPESSRKLVYAESFANEVRLALRPPGGPRERRLPSRCTQPQGVGS